MKGYKEHGVQCSPEGNCYNIEGELFLYNILLVSFSALTLFIGSQVVLSCTIALFIRRAPLALPFQVGTNFTRQMVTLYTNTAERRDVLDDPHDQEIS